VTAELLTTFGLGARIDAHAGAVDGQTLCDSLTQHAVVVLARVEMDEEVLVAIARLFGEPEAVNPVEHRSRHNPFVRIQSNVDGLGLNQAGEYWHSDGPWSETPSAATVLLCAEAPSQGGETLFVDMRAAYDALPSDLRDWVADRRGSFPCREIYARELEAAGLRDPEKLQQLRDLEHPLVRVHPRSGRRALYLNEQWLHSIRGLSPKESEAKLKVLYEFSTSGMFTYTHRWSVGDLLVWDNVSVMHKARPTPSAARKVMLRVTIAGSAPEAATSGISR
jgi:taurine dioxygenase